MMGKAKVVKEERAIKAIKVSKESKAVSKEAKAKVVK